VIVNIRGTSGSGKSYLVRAVMDRYFSREAIHVEGRKQPLCYRLKRQDGGRDLWVIGHYEGACGGADTVKTIDQTYHLVRNGHAGDLDVIYEGLVAQNNVTKCIELHQEGFPLLVVALNTSLEDCQKSIQARRDAKGDDRQMHRVVTPEMRANLTAQDRRFLDAGIPYGMLNTAKSHDTVLRLQVPRLRAAGVDCRVLDRAAALAAVLAALGLR